jgi:hypothetical protein
VKTCAGRRPNPVPRRETRRREQLPGNDFVGRCLIAGLVVSRNEAIMFETLEEQIEKSESSHLSTQQKVFRLVGLFGLTAVVFGALFMAVQMFG